MKKIAFHDNTLTIRGTTVSLYDYANYCEKFFGYKSIIVIPTSSLGKNDDIAVKKFMDRFELFFYKDLNELENILENEMCDIFYSIKYGINDGVFSTKIKSCIHCVFYMADEHGDVYAGVSEQIANKFGKTLYVPHMISLEPSKTKENLRNVLGIPENATVFGYHGGFDSFNIHFAMEVVKKAVRVLDNVYFIFVNIQRFDNHSNIFFLNKIINDDDKNRFISSCDACLEAQSLGQSFGLSLAEFSINNKPIITFGGVVLNDNYKRILKDKAIYYKNETELMDIIANFDKNEYINKDLNCYKEYSPENVMKIFKKVFLD